MIEQKLDGSSGFRSASPTRLTVDPLWPTATVLYACRIGLAPPAAVLLGFYFSVCQLHDGLIRVVPAVLCLELQARRGIPDWESSRRRSVRHQPQLEQRIPRLTTLHCEGLLVVVGQCPVLLLQKRQVSVDVFDRINDWRACTDIGNELRRILGF
jgi:hypothetical protein